MRVALIVLLASTSIARERINGMYFGENVSFKAAGGTAAEFYADGTVIIHIGAVIPNLHDDFGQPVKIRKVRTVHE